MNSSGLPEAERRRQGAGLVTPPVSLSGSSQSGGTVGSSISQHEGGGNGSNNRTKRSNSNAPRPDLRMSPYPRGQYTQRYIPPEREVPAIGRRHFFAPPPLAPYVTPDKRHFAPFPENFTGSDPRWALSNLIHLSGSHHPSVPPPQRPAPPHIPPPPPKAQAPPSPPSSRDTDSRTGVKQPTPKSHSESPFLPQHAKHPDRPLFPPSSRERFPPPGQSRRGPSNISAKMERPQQSSSRSTYPQSTFSAKTTSSQPGHTDYSGLTPSSGSGQSGGSISPGHQQSDPAQDGQNPELQRPKRTRILMTHIQQQRLSALWRKASCLDCDLKRVANR